MTADRIPALLEPIQNRLNAECDGSSTCNAGLHVEGCFRTNPDFAQDATAPTDQARLLAAVQAVERTAKYLDKLADGDRHYANLFRKAVIEALGGEANV